MTAPSPAADGYPDRDIATSDAGYAGRHVRPDPAHVAADVLAELHRWRFRLDDEAALQGGTMRQAAE